jgi:protein SCO1/2
MKHKKSVIGGDWTLIDMNGNPISSNDLSGAYYIVYFGFTKCPDICPSTLYKLSKVLKIIKSKPEAHYLNVKVVFISVDPARDTPPILKKYLNNFSD